MYLCIFSSFRLLLWFFFMHGTQTNITLRKSQLIMLCFVVLVFVLISSGVDGEICFEIVMEDSYGDGFNGNEIVIEKEGEIIFNSTLKNGFFGTANVCLVEEACYFSWIRKGYFTEEISWSFTGTDLKKEGDSVAQFQVVRSLSEYYIEETNCGQILIASIEPLNAALSFLPDAEIQIFGSIEMDTTIFMFQNSATVFGSTADAEYFTLSGKYERRLFSLANKAALVINKMKLIGGYASDFAGGIYLYSQSNLTLIDCVVSEHFVLNGNGAFLFSIDSFITIIHTTFKYNVATSSSTNDGQGAVLWLYNSKANLFHVQASKNQAKEGALAYVSAFSYLHISNSSASSNGASHSAGLIKIESAGQLIIDTDTKFWNNAARYYGGAIAAESSIDDQDKTLIFIQGVQFYQHLAFEGAAVYNKFGNLSIYSSSFQHGRAHQSAGGILNDGGSYAQIKDCYFYNNTAVQGGSIWNRGYVNYALSLFQGAYVKIESSFFMNSYAEITGGGIYSYAPFTIISDCKFQGNYIANPTFSETALGGSIYINVLFQATINRCSFLNSYSLFSGGAVSALGDAHAVLSINNSFFQGNAVPTDRNYFQADCEANAGDPSGGALQVRFLNELIIANTTFNSNYAKIAGALFAQDINTISITNNTSFTSNFASEYGGSVYFESFDKVLNVSISDGVIFFNNTAIYGSVLYATGLNTLKILDNVSLMKNRAQLGTVYIQNSNKFEIFGNNLHLIHNTANDAVILYASELQSFYAGKKVQIKSNIAENDCFRLIQVKSAIVSSHFESNLGSLFTLEETLIDIADIFVFNNTAIQGSIFYVAEDSNAEIIFSRPGTLEANFATSGTILFAAPFSTITLRPATSFLTIEATQQSLNIIKNHGFSGLFYAGLGSTVLVQNIHTEMNNPEYIFDIHPQANLSIQNCQSYRDYNLRNYLRAQTESILIMDKVKITETTDLLSVALIEIIRTSDVYLNSLFITNTSYELSGETSIFLLISVHNMRLLNSIFMNNQGTAIHLEESRAAKIRSTLIFGTYFQNGLIAVQSDVSIFDCNFISNMGSSALYAQGSIVHMTNTNFTKNHASRGAALLATDASIIHVQKTIFASNQATDDGAATLIEEFSSMNLISSEFYENLARRGAGIFLSTNASLRMLNTTRFKKNKAEQGGAVFIHITSTKEPNLANAIFIQNSAGYGPDFATEATSLAFTDNNEPLVIASGQLIEPSLAVKAFDFFGQHCSTISGIVRFSTIESDVTLSGTTEVAFNQSGIARTPADFRLRYFVGSTIILIAKLESLIALKHIIFRECIIGEYINGDKTECIICNAADVFSLSVSATSCTACLEHARCNGNANEGSFLTPNAGYWKSSALSTNIRKCPYSNNCRGDVNLFQEESNCKYKTSGPMCSLCTDNNDQKRVFDQWTGRCISCSGQRKKRQLIIGIIIIILIILVPFATIKLKELCTVLFDAIIPKLQAYIIFLQIVMQQCIIFARFLRFPQTFSLFANSFGSVITLNVFGWLQSSICFKGNHLIKLRVYTLIPLLLFFSFIILARKSKHMAYFALTLPYFVYTIVSETILSTFRCDIEFRREDGEVGDYLNAKFLEVDYSIHCDSRIYRLSFVYAALMVLVYPIGIALSFFFLLFPHRKQLFPPNLETIAMKTSTIHQAGEEYKKAAQIYLQLQSTLRETAEINHLAAIRLESAVESAGRDFAATLKSDEHIHRSFSFLYADYRRDRWWFEAFGECPRRLILASVIPAMFRSNDLALLYTTFLTAIIYTAAYDYLRPFVDIKLNRFSILLQSMLVAILFFTIVLYFEESCDDDAQSNCEKAGWDIGVIGAILIFLTIVVAPVEIVIEMRNIPLFTSSLLRRQQQDNNQNIPISARTEKNEEEEGTISSPTSSLSSQHQQLIACISEKKIHGITDDEIFLDVETNNATNINDT